MHPEEEELVYLWFLLGQILSLGFDGRVGARRRLLPPQSVLSGAGTNICHIGSGAVEEARPDWKWAAWNSGQNVPTQPSWTEWNRQNEKQTKKVTLSQFVYLNRCRNNKARKDFFK